MPSTFPVETHIPFLETLFEPWQEVIGSDYQGYRNHVYRMVQFTWAIQQLNGKTLCEDDKTKIMIAGVYHDIGIWVGNTLDYLEPSIPPAMKYLEENGLEAWKAEITLMINEHHKLHQYSGEYQTMVELFRKGDLVDFSLGTFRSGLPKKYVKEMQAALPNKGFHKGLLKKGMQWFFAHPLNPVPMMKW